MEDFGTVLSTSVEVLKTPFTIWGFTLNFWDMGIWMLIASILVVLIVRFLYDR